MVLFKKFIGALALIAFSIVALQARRNAYGRNAYDGYSDPSQQSYDPSQQSYDPSQQSYDPSQQGFGPSQKGFAPQPYQQGYSQSAPAPQPYQQYNPGSPAPQPYQQGYAPSAPAPQPYQQGYAPAPQPYQPGYAPSAPAPQPYQQYNPGAPAPQPYQQGVMLGAVAPQAQPQSGGQQQAQQNFVPQQSQQQLPLVQAPAPANTQVISVTAVERDTTQDIDQDDNSLKAITAEEAQLEKGSTTRLNNAFGSLFGSKNSKEVATQQKIFNAQVIVLNNGVTYCTNIAVKLQTTNAISANSSTGAAKILAALNKEIDAIGTDIIAAQKLVTRTITYGKDSGTGSRADVLRAAVADMQTLLSQIQGILGRLQLIDAAINGSANVDATEYDYATLSANWTTAKVVKPAK